MPRFRLLLISFGVWLVTVAPCLAQATGEEPEVKSYVTSYFLVGLGIALGLVAICRPSKRRKEVKRPEA